MKRSVWTGGGRVLAAALLGAWLGCRANTEQLIQQGRVAEAIDSIVVSDDAQKDQWDSRYLLGSAFFARAQHALEAGNEAEYASQLAAAQEQLLRSVDLAPNADQAHNLLAMLSAYHTDLDGARRSFDIARQLNPSEPIYYVNLAELEVYRGQLQRAEQYLQSARKLGAVPADVELTEALAAWRRGDLYQARDIFREAAMLDPETARKWNGATAIKTFNDFADHCCRLPFCGHYMKDACKQMKLEVKGRDLQRKTLLRELQLEAERRKAMSDIYGRRRDLEIQLGDPTPPDPNSIAAAPAQAAAPLAADGSDAGSPRHSMALTPSTPGADYTGTPGEDRLIGGPNADYLSGLAGDDRLEGGGDADVLEGGEGDDTLIGGPGNDVYVLGPRTGMDLIVEEAAPGSFDWLYFEQVKLADLKFQREGDDLLVLAGDGSSGVRVQDFFRGDRIEWIDAQDGGLSATEIAERVARGSSSN